MGFAQKRGDGNPYGSGDDQDRTDDPRNAIAVLSQLSYVPVLKRRCCYSVDHLKSTGIG